MRNLGFDLPVAIPARRQPGLHKIVTGDDDASLWFSNFMMRTCMVAALATLAYGASFWA